MNSNIRKLTAGALFCALAYLCVFFFRINISFLTFEIKSVVITIGALFLGPMYAVIISLIVSFLEFITISETGVYGLIMNFLATATFSATASLVYKYHRKISGAIWGLILSSILMTVTMLLANLFITPFYFGISVDEVKSMIPNFLLPFNVIKAVINAALVMFLYKPVSISLQRIGFSENTSSSDYHIKGKTTVILFVSGLIAIVGIILLLTIFKGKFELFRSF